MTNRILEIPITFHCRHCGCESSIKVIYKADDYVKGRYKEGVELFVNYRQLKQTALFLTEGVKQVVETIGLFTVALEAILVAPTKSAFKAKPQDWHTNSDCDFRLPLEIW